jgi:hypothetical protein
MVAVFCNRVRLQVRRRQTLSNGQVGYLGPEFESLKIWPSDKLLAKPIPNDYALVRRGYAHSSKVKDGPPSQQHGHEYHYDANNRN